MREVKVKAAAPAALRRKVRRPARSIACSSLGMTANHGNAAEAGRGEKPTRTISKKLGIGGGAAHRIAQPRSQPGGRLLVRTLSCPALSSASQFGLRVECPTVLHLQ